MMNPIITEKEVSFKDLEQAIYRSVCELGCLITRSLLEGYDDRLCQGRDTKAYRHKGKRRTTIKTVYGEVEYERAVYETRTGEGQKGFVYLLDEALQMEKVGLISTNLAQKIAMAVAEMPYRATAETISDTCGQSISHGGVWNLVQSIGEKVSQEEQALVNEMESGKARGVKEVAVLFEEMDGVWLKMQGKDHKKAKSQELKVATTYEGWECDGKGNSALAGKTVIAGMEKSDLFHRKREAQLESVYNADEIAQRVLNGDGAGWIRDPYDPDVIVQLDRFHIYQEIKRRIRDREAEKAIKELFEQEKIGEMLRYIEIYADSIASDDPGDKGSEKAQGLHGYLSNHREALLPYQSRGIDLPGAREGLVYKNMGVQENQNCTVITLRMKNRRMRWSPHGANNMAKVLYKKENKDLMETIERCTDGAVSPELMEESITILSAAKAPKKDGKGDPYFDLLRHRVPMFDGMRTASRKAFKKALGF
jgi:hypothetical protein